MAGYNWRTFEASLGRGPALKLASLKVSFVAGTLAQGGAERQLFYTLNILKECQANVEVLSLTRGEFWEDRIRALGIPVIWVGQSPSRVVRLARIIKEIRRFRPRFVQSQHFYTNLYAILAVRSIHATEICALRNDVVSEVKDLGAILGWLSLRTARLLAPNSHKGYDSAVALGVSPSRLQFVPNVVDSEHFLPSGDRNGRTKVIGVGRLDSQKRFDRFISVISQVTQDPTISLHSMIVGAGPLEADLKKIAINLEMLPKKIEFRHPVADTLPIYTEADILLLTSDHEGTPNVVLEAMSCGLAVVATRVGDVGALIKHGETGFLLEPDDDAGLAEAVRLFCMDATLRKRMGMRAREFVVANHSLGILPDHLLKLYEKAETCDPRLKDPSRSWR